VDFALTSTQRELSAAARRYLADTFPVDRVAGLANGLGIDSGTWPELTRQGWLDPGLGMVELGLLAQESGYGLHPTPWWTTVALTGWQEPSTVVTGEIEARREGDRWLLSGSATLVPDAGTAEAFLVEAGGRGFRVAKQQAVVRDCTSLDPLRRMSDVHLVNAEATPCACASRERAAVLLACEAVGVAARAIDFALDHAKTREQFGRPIGSFQAVAHHLAESYVELELARSLALRASWMSSLAEPPDDLPAAVGSAVIAARQAAVRCCEIAVQTLGGMGVTWEHPLHLWFRRALWSESFRLALPDPHATVAAAILQ
jgi:acyl-CoA dehydrogenase